MGNENVRRQGITSNEVKRLVKDHQQLGLCRCGLPAHSFFQKHSPQSHSCLSCIRFLCFFNLFFRVKSLKTQFKHHLSLKPYLPITLASGRTVHTLLSLSARHSSRAVIALDCEIVHPTIETDSVILGKLSGLVQFLHL